MQSEVAVTTCAADYLDLLAERVPDKVTKCVLGALLGGGGVIAEPAQLRTDECDGLTGYRVTPAPSVALTRWPLPDRLRP